MLKNAQNHTLLSENIRNRLWEKITSYWICKNNWSINRLTGYGVTTLQVFQSMQFCRLMKKNYSYHFFIEGVEWKLLNGEMVQSNLHLSVH